MKLYLNDITYLESEGEARLILFCRDRKRKRWRVDVVGFRARFYVEKGKEEKLLRKFRDRILEIVNEGIVNIRGKPMLTVYSRLPKYVGGDYEIDGMPSMRKWCDDHKIETAQADVLFPVVFLVVKEITSGIEIPTPKDQSMRYVEVNEKDVKACNFPTIARLWNLDIETDPRNLKVEFKVAIAKGRMPITAISFHDSFTNKLYTVYWKKLTKKSLKRIEEFKSNDNAWKWFNYECKSEKHMLILFKKMVKKFDFDLCTGWNVELFDWFTILKRMQILKVDRKDLSPIERCYLRKDNFNIKLRNIIDLATMYRTIEAITYFESLEGAMTEVFNRHKVFHTINTGDWWEQDCDGMLYYNAVDVEGTHDLNKFRHIIKFFDELKRQTGCLWTQIFNASLLVDPYILRVAQRLGICLPNKRKISQDIYALKTDFRKYETRLKELCTHRLGFKVKETKKRRLVKLFPIRNKERELILYLKSKRIEIFEEAMFPGAVVLVPKRGRHRYVIELDLKSLYPMMMLTCNMGVDTLLPRDYEGDCITIPNGLKFRKDKDSLTRIILREFLDNRAKMRKKRDSFERETDDFIEWDAKQYAYKQITNAMWGIIALATFRLGSSDIADGIVSGSLLVNTWTAEVIDPVVIVSILSILTMRKFKRHSKTFRVIYSDTDSTFVKILKSKLILDKDGEINKEKLKKLTGKLLVKVTKSYEIFNEIFNVDENYFLNKMDLFADPICLVMKKNYFLKEIFDDKWREVNKIEKKGLARKDQAVLSAEIKEVLFKAICDFKSNKVIIKYIRKKIQQLLDGKIPLQKIGIWGSVKKGFQGYKTGNAHVRAAITSNYFLGTNFGTGDRWMRLPLLSLPKNMRPSNDAFGRRISKGAPLIAFVDERQLPDEVRNMIDYKLLVDKLIKKKTEKILLINGITWKDILGGKKQKGFK